MFENNLAIELISKDNTRQYDDSIISLTIITFHHNIKKQTDVRKKSYSITFSWKI